MSFTGDTHLFKKRPQTTDRDPQEAIPLNLPKTMRFDNGSHIHKHINIYRHIAYIHINHFLP